MASRTGESDLAVDGDGASIWSTGSLGSTARHQPAPGHGAVSGGSGAVSGGAWGSAFRVRWQTIYDLSFGDVAHLHNAYNESKPIKISRDGQEVEPEVGRRLCVLIDEGYVANPAQVAISARSPPDLRPISARSPPDLGPISRAVDEATPP